MKHWYNNSNVEVQLDDNVDIPDGFVKGRLPFSDECKRKMGESRLGQYHRKNNPYHTEEDKKKISDGMKKYFAEHGHPSTGKHPWNYGLKGVQPAWNKGMKYEDCHTSSKQDMVSSIIKTKRANKSFSTSKSELEFFELLKDVFNESDIIHHYKDERYPFVCDFYIKSEDLFIECNFHWTHGGKPFNSDDVDCQNQLLIWQEKAKTSQYHSNAINTWTNRDVVKLQTAIQNNLKYIAIYKNYPNLEEVQRLSKGYSERNIQILLK